MQLQKQKEKLHQQFHEYGPAQKLKDRFNSQFNKSYQQGSFSQEESVPLISPSQHLSKYRRFDSTSDNEQEDLRSLSRLSDQRKLSRNSNTNSYDNLPAAPRLLSNQIGKHHQIEAHPYSNSSYTGNYHFIKQKQTERIQKDHSSPKLKP